MEVIELRIIHFCLLTCDRRIQKLTYTEVLLPTNESIILSCPLPSWGGRKEELTREVAPLPTRLHWN